MADTELNSWDNERGNANVRPIYRPDLMAEIPIPGFAGKKNLNPCQ
jgi:hypothetical protein